MTYNVFSGTFNLTQLTIHHFRPSLFNIKFNRKFYNNWHPQATTFETDLLTKCD